MRTIYIIFGVLCIFALFLRYYLFFTKMPKFYDGEHLSFETLLLSDPTTSHHFQTFSTIYTTKTSSGQLFISIPEDVKISFGDPIRIDGKVRMRGIKGTNKVIATMHSPKLTIVREKSLLFSAAYF